MGDVVELHVALVGCGTEPEERFRAFPEDHSIKGMYFPRLVAQLSPSELELAGLREPPRGGRYLPFKSYPQHDYSRVAYLAACKQHPRLSTREAMRRVARDDFQQFAESRVGKISLSFISDCGEALRRLPDLFNMSLTGGSFGAEREGDRVRLQFRDYHGWLDCYMFGVLEGIVLSFGNTPRLEADLATECEGTVDVTWS